METHTCLKLQNKQSGGPELNPGLLTPNLRLLLFGVCGLENSPSLSFGRSCRVGNAASRLHLAEEQLVAGVLASHPPMWLVTKFTGGAGKIEFILFGA